jgi:Divergent InlB B-repeat domain/PASTA domain
VTKGGLGTGTVSSKPAGISCGGTCSFVFGEGQQIALTGTPSGETEAVKWSGCDSVDAENHCLVTMSSAREVGALFDVEGPTLTVLKQGNGEGTVTSSPVALNCGAACAVNFPQDSQVTLKGTPGLHSEAVKWAGCDSVNPKGECLVAMSSAREVSATFKLEAQWAEFTISLQRLGTGQGTVSSIPAGIACPPDCSDDFLFKSSVTLIATPEVGSALDHWSVNACTTSPLCAITVQNDRTVKAVFDAIGTRTLAVSKAGTGSGLVRSTNVGGIECGSACSAELDATVKVVLTATPSAGSSFAGWSGEGCGGIKNCRVTMNEARNVTATFTKGSAPPQASCHVPKLKGKSLAKARRALGAAHCSLGKVRKPKGAKGKLVVRSSSPPAGSVRPAGAKVSLRLRRGR